MIFPRPCRLEGSTFQAARMRLVDGVAARKGAAFPQSERRSRRSSSGEQTAVRRGPQDIAANAASGDGAGQILSNSPPAQPVVFLILSEMSIIDLIREP